MLVFILSLAWGVPALDNISMVDDGQFGAWATHMLQGKYLYKDIYITYGPLYVYPLYFLFKNFGPSLLLLRLYFILGTSLGIIAAYICMNQLRVSRKIRWLVIILLLLFPVISLRQGAGYVVLFLYSLAVRKERPYLFGFTGAAIGVTFLISPDIGIVVGLICFLMSVFRSIQSKSAYKELLSLGIGLLVAFGLFSTWARAEGWLESYITTTVDVFSSFSGVEVPNGQNFPNVIKLAPNSMNIFEWIKFLLSKELMVYWLLVFYVGVLYFFLKKLVLRQLSSQDMELWLMFLYGLFLYPILLSRSGIGHLFFVISPAFIVGGVIVEKLWNSPHSKKNKIFDRKVFLVLMVLILLFIVRLITIYRIEITKNLQLYFTQPAASQIGYVEHVKKLIESNSSPSDTIFVFDNEPMVYMFTSRMNPTRYDLPFLASSREKRLEILSSFISYPPTLIIKSHKAWDVDEVSNKVRLPEVWRFIENNYYLIEKTPDVDIYKINQKQF